MEPYPTSLHLAMAAFFGASLMAISAFFIHKRSVDQILEHLIQVRQRITVENDVINVDDELLDEDDEINEEFDVELEEDEDDEDDREKVENFNMNLNKAISYGISSSVPNFSVGFSNSSNFFDDDDDVDVDDDDECVNTLSSSLDKSKVPLFQRFLKSGVGISLRTSTSSIEIDSESLNKMPLENTVSSNGYCEEFQDRDVVCVQEIKSSADSDGKLDVQKPPAVPQTQKRRVAACERKAILDLPANVELDMAPTEAEENDFTAVLPLNSAIPVPLNTEEEEVRRMLRECLKLREGYIYQEQVAPWSKPVDTTAEENKDPFHFYPVEKTDHDFRMEDGVLHVYASKNDTVELFPVPSATQFFTDMHHILKVVSTGNVNSACYHRLRFLEEIGNFWIRRVHHIVISTTLERLIHIYTILLV